MSKRSSRVSILEKEIDNQPVIMTEFGYKTLTMVTKSIGWFTRRTSPTYYRTSGVMETEFGQPEVSFTYPKQSVDYIMNLYRSNGVTEYDTVVIGPGLETCCYIGAALNAPVLPSQFIASAPDCEFVELNSSSENIYVIGHETDWPKLCIWIKPLNLGNLYSLMLEQAKNVILVTAHAGIDNKHGTPRDFIKDNLSIISLAQGGKRFQDLIGDAESRGFKKVNDRIPHWEFAMESEQIKQIEQYCAERGKRTVTINSGDWIGFLPTLLFIALYKKNGFVATGITFNSYWCCHPYYEAELLRIPVCSFQYGSEKYVNEFRKILESIDFSQKNGEYIVWPPELNRTKSMNPRARFESWGFPTRYKSSRAYDVWCWGWSSSYDLMNPTREWIIPRLNEQTNSPCFNAAVSVDELIGLVQSIPKTNVLIKNSLFSENSS